MKKGGTVLFTTMHNRFQTADNQTGANHGRVANAPTDQRRFAALASANGRAKTRPSRGTQSRATAGGTVFHAPSVRRADEVVAHPWLVTLKTDDEDKLAVIKEGLIFDALLSVTKIKPTLTEDTVIDGDLVCLEYKYAVGEVPASIKSIIVPSADFVPYTEDEEDPPVLLTVRQPIASISENEETSALEVEQIQLGNSLALTSACINGKILKVLSPL